MRIPVTAVVVSLNEGFLLESALPNLQFCQRIIVVDIGSSDNTQEVAEKFGAEVWTHERVPVVEIIHEWVQDKIDTDWMLITDPDEVISDRLQDQLVSIFKGLPDDIGSVTVPWVFLFGKRILKGGPWGGINKRVLLVKLKGFVFSGHVHSGRSIRHGYRNYTINFTKDNCIYHHWMQGYGQLISKHRRYLKEEGKARYEKGMRARRKKLLVEPFKQFRHAVIHKRALRDGLIGFMLSIFWSWYQTLAMWELWKYQRKISTVES